MGSNAMGSNVMAAVMDAAADATIETPRTPLRGPVFETPTPFGSIRLTALEAIPARHAADAAIALDRHAPLLDALELWFDQPLDWQWRSSPQPLTESLAKMLYRSEGSANIQCGLTVPWALLRALPTPPAVLAERLHWPTIPVVLAIAALDIPPAELADLEPGGALVLPDSMQPEWRGALRATEEAAGRGAGLPVTLADPSAPRTVRASGVPTVGGDSRGYEVRLAIAQSIATDRLAGWTETTLGAVDDRASLWRCGADGNPGIGVARGRLIPWGIGWALAIETLCEAPVRE